MLLNPPIFQYVDADGKPLAFAKIYLYLSGTTTPVSAYHDAAMEHPQPWPIVADAQGLFPPMYVASRSLRLKLVVHNGDVENPLLDVDPAHNVGNGGSSFGSKEEAEGSSMPYSLMAVRTDGFYSAGDGGGGLYRRADAEPAHEGKFQSVDGAWWELVIDAGFNVRQLGAVADATWDPVTKAVTGTDNTAALNAALALGRPILPRGLYRYSGALKVVVDHGGLVGEGFDSALVSDALLDRHLGVQAGKVGFRFERFRMIGPHDHNGSALNRAVTFGMKADWSGITDAPWDAVGGWWDALDIIGYRTGVHAVLATGLTHGDFRVSEMGDDAAEPGSYGMVVSSGTVTGRSIEARAGAGGHYRHAVYHTGQANDCWIDRIYAEGSAMNAYNERCAEGGGRNNGFGHLEAVNCRPGAAAGDVGGAAFGTADDATTTTHVGSRFGKIVMRDSGGEALQVRNAIAPDLGQVEVVGHNGVWGSGNHRLVYIYNCTRPRLPDLTAVVGFGAGGLNDNTLRPYVAQQCTDISAGSLRFDGRAQYLTQLSAVTGGRMGEVTANMIGTAAVNMDGCVGVRAASLILRGSYNYAVRYAGATDRCGVDAVTPLDAPATALHSDVSSGSKLNDTWYAPGYDRLVVAADAPTVTGYRYLDVTYASAGDLNTLAGGFPAQALTLVCTNTNVTVKHNATAGGYITLNGAADKSGTRRRIALTRHAASDRWLEAG